MSSLKKKTSIAGFSLVELMIVVAIIGILTAVAVPNFRRFQLKSRQTEARNNLAALYAAEKAFQQEWAQYFGDFRDLGFAPEGNLIYTIGFGGAGLNTPATYNYAGGVGAGANAAVQFNSTVFCGADPNCTEVAVHVNAGATAARDGNDVVPTAVAFTAVAASDLDRNGTAGDYDVWTINQAKTMVNVQSDVN